MLTSGVPLPLVSKTWRNATSGITANLYGHLTAKAALGVADSALGAVWTPLRRSCERARIARCDHTTMIRACSAATFVAKPLIRRGAASGNRIPDLLITSRPYPALWSLPATKREHWPPGDADPPQAAP
jgi:hypothetical protein